MPIIDQGYQHWAGHTSGHAWRWLAISRHGIRVGMKDWKTRGFILFAWILPTIVLTGFLCGWSLLERNAATFRPFAEMLRVFGFGPEAMANPKSFRVEFWTLCYSRFMGFELFMAMVLILLVGRQLISQDLRFNAMPLYFSRPLRRSDYFLGKLGVVVGYLAMVIFIPSLIAYVLGLAFSLDISILRDTLPLLISVLLYGLLIAVSAGTLILAISSLSRNSRNVGLIWVALWLVSNIVAGALNTTYMIQHRGDTPGAMLAAQTEPANWRPMISYTENLSRIGQQLMGTDACWKKLAELQPVEMRPQFLALSAGPQYPWIWSAGVLAALFVLSALVLHFRVRSLDRLR